MFFAIFRSLNFKVLDLERIAIFGRSMSSYMNLESVKMVCNALIVCCNFVL
jgi:hypothetical protein